MLEENINLLKNLQKQYKIIKKNSGFFTQKDREEMLKLHKNINIKYYDNLKNYLLEQKLCISQIKEEDYKNWCELRNNIKR